MKKEFFKEKWIRPRYYPSDVEEAENDLESVIIEAIADHEKAEVQTMITLTKEEILRENKFRFQEAPFEEMYSKDTEAILYCMEVYKAQAIAKADASKPVIKAKALRKKNNPEKWITYNYKINKWLIEAAPTPIYPFEELPPIPTDAELIDIEIIIKEGGE